MDARAAVSRAVDRPVRWRWLLTGAVVAVAAALAVAAPPDAVQGDAQRLMYLHVPTAWCAFVAFAVVAVTSARYLLRRRAVDQVRARAAAEVGVVLTALAIVTGSVWGRLTWGTWWVWDARLTTTVALLLVYVAYLALRALVHGERAQRLTAAFGVLSFLMVPVVHFSVLWWRTLHQPPTILAPSVEPPIDGQMALALVASLVAAMLVSGLVWHRRVEGLLPSRQDGRTPAGLVAVR